MTEQVSEPVTDAEALLLAAYRGSAPPYTDLPHSYFELPCVVVVLPRSLGKSTSTRTYPVRRFALEQLGQSGFLRLIREYHATER